jgi:hypothetical protein
MNTSKIEKIKKLEKQAEKKKHDLLAPCFMDYSPNTGNEAYEWFKIQLEKGYPPDQIVVFINGMDCGKGLYKFDYAAYKEAERELQKTGKSLILVFSVMSNAH